MSWRWFYSTEESDTALKAILDASKFSREYTRNENSLTDGMIEYKVWIEQDTEFLLLSSKVDAAKIRALSSPERVAQFGNLRPDNYFDTTKYAAGCAYRDTDILANMIVFLSAFKEGTLIAQRDMDIQGSASLGTVALILSSLYKKTYNIPVNGSVSDRTLVKAVRDSTAPAATQTNATCNQAMFDFAEFATHRPISVTSQTGWLSKDTDANLLAIVTDKKASIATVEYVMSALTTEITLDLGSVVNGTPNVIFDVLMGDATGTAKLKSSTNGTTWTTHATATGYTTKTTIIQKSSSNVDLRYIRIENHYGTTNTRIWPREMWVDKR